VRLHSETKIEKEKPGRHEDGKVNRKESLEGTVLDLE
jgi:hypothetical protein